MAYADSPFPPSRGPREPGGRLYVEAAHGALQRQIAFGSSYPFRAMRQSAEDYMRLGFGDDVLGEAMYANAKGLLNPA